MRVGECKLSYLNYVCLSVLDYCINDTNKLNGKAFLWPRARVGVVKKLDCKHINPHWEGELVYEYDNIPFLLYLSYHTFLNVYLLSNMNF